MRVRNTILVLCALALLVLPLGASADEPVGVVERIEGRVDLLRAGGAATAARTGDPVMPGDAIRTKWRSKAEVRLRDDSVIQIAPESKLVIDEYTFGAGGRERGMLSLLRGKVRAIVSKLRAAVVPVSQTDSSFNLRTPTTVAGVKGTDFIVYYERGVSGIIFIEGEGFVFNPAFRDRIVTIRGGQATFVRSKRERPLPPRPVSNVFTAPHLRDTTISLTEARGETIVVPSAGSFGGGAAADPAAAVVMLNSSYASLTDLQISEQQRFPAGDDQLVRDLLSPFGGLQTSPPPSLIPFTETKPSLLGATVTITVVVP